MSASTLANFMEANLGSRDSGLGDRSLYFGASEILSCEEAMYLSKVKKIQKRRTLQELIVLSRGHIGETLVEWGFGKMLNYESQVEVCGQGEFEFIKAHIDFVVHFPNESIIVEVKTTNDIPSSIRQEWLSQVQLQMGLSSIKRASGIKRAKVFAMNLNNGFHKEFDVEFSKLLFENSLKDIKIKWDKIHNNPEQIKGTKSALCANCPFKTHCKTLQTDNILPEEIVKMAKELQQRKKEQKVLESNIRAFMEAANYDRARGHDVVVELSERFSSKKLDFNKLKTQFPDVYKKCCSEGRSTAMNIY